jgi:trimeric autotransporter adhesin
MDSQLTWACLHVPRGGAVDSNRNVYIADERENRVRKVRASDGTITTVAGTGIGGFSGDGGAAVFAKLHLPTGVAVDDHGNLYLADWDNNRIRKVSASGVITTVAGTSTATFSGDNGPATKACLHAPFSVGVDGLGNVYIADQGDVKVCKITVATGIISTVVGGGNGLCDRCIATKGGARGTGRCCPPSIHDRRGYQPALCR